MYDSLYLSPYSTANEEQSYFELQRKRIEKQQVQVLGSHINMDQRLTEYAILIQKYSITIQQLCQQVQCLKSINLKLTVANASFQSEISNLKQNISEMQIKTLLQQHQKPPKSDHKDKTDKTNRLESLMKQTLKIKQNMRTIRAQCDSNKSKIKEQQDLIESYERMKVDWKWKQNFIELFANMIGTISQDIDDDWSEKKKIQVGWKIVKSILHKALGLGVKVPRVQRRSQVE